MAYWDDWDDGWDEPPKNQRMSSKRSHPFAITCRSCGSNSVMVIPYEYGHLGIQCRRCGKSINCGTYYTDEGDYSEC